MDLESHFEESLQAYLKCLSQIKLNNRFVALFGTKTGTCLACGLEIERAAAVTSLLRSTREDCQVNKQRYN